MSTSENTRDVKKVSVNYSNKVMLFLQAFLTALALNTELGVIEGDMDGIGNVVLSQIYAFMDQVESGISGKGFYLTILSVMLFGIYTWISCKKKVFPESKHVLLGAFLSIMYTGGMAYWYGGSLLLLYSFPINWLRGVVLLFGMYFFYVNMIEILHYILHAKLEKAGSNTEKNRKVLQLYRKYHFWVTWGIIMLVWFIHLMLRYPGAMSYDNWEQLKYYYGLMKYTTAQPIFHTWLFGSFIRIGIKLGGPNVGLFLFVLMQSLIMSAVLAWTLELMKRWNTASWIRKLTFAVYCVAPYFVGYAAFPIKDYLYTAFLVLLVCLMAEWMILRGQFWQHIGKNVLWIVGTTLMILCRKNGIYLYFVVATVVLVQMGLHKMKSAKDTADSRQPEADKRKKSAAWKQWMRTAGRKLIVVCLPFVLVFVVEGIITQVYHVEKDSPKEMFSLPFQQTARYVKEYGNELPEDEKEAIAQILNYDSLAEVYDPMTADPVKGTYHSESTRDLVTYFKVWLKEFFKHPLCYVEATWNQSYYVFAPYRDNVVYNKDCMVGSVLEVNSDHYSWLNFQIPEKMEGLANVTVKLYSLLTTAPVIGMFSNVAFYVILMFVLLHFIRLGKNKRAFFVMLPAVISFLFVLLAPQIQGQPRYAFPIIYTMPLMIAFYQRTGKA